jgi:hypothetical protein
MFGHSDEQLASSAKKRLTPFLDCVSYLLARRWLRDQQQEAEEPSLEMQTHHDDRGDDSECE